MVNIRSPMEFIYDIEYKLRTLRICICQDLFHRTIFFPILHSELRKYLNAYLLVLSTLG